MDSRYSAQDVLRCDLCKTNAVQSHCELCHINLCKVCVGEHLSDQTKKHRVVPYTERTSTPNYPKCPKHSKNCEYYCESCDISACSTCFSSGKHKGHYLSDVLQKISSKTNEIKKDLRELEVRITTYEDIASDIKNKKDSLEEYYGKQTIAVTKQGEDWHREINIIVNEQKSEIDDVKTKHLSALNEQENEITRMNSEVKQSIVDLKNILESNDATLASVYKSRNEEFRQLPPEVKVSLPVFSPQKINTEQLHQMFGALTFCPPLLDVPELITTIDTKYDKLYSVTCLNDEEIWTGGEEKIMKLYNLQGNLLKSIKTKSGKNPCDMVVTRSGDLVYTDPDTRTVNIVKKKRIEEVIRLQEWKPCYVCSTSSGDLLVTMDSTEQSKVVRYSGSTEKQTIQFDSKGRLLYLPGSPKHIRENRNLDICVADFRASAIVVVNQAGKLRFRYTGPPSTTRKSFYPHGITTDSQSQILTADYHNNCIHILDYDGYFLRFIDNCDLQLPYSLCVDIRDNLFVAECSRGNVKKIKYM